jgi:hypothetical protein
MSFTSLFVFNLPPPSLSRQLLVSHALRHHPCVGVPSSAAPTPPARHLFITPLVRRLFHANLAHMPAVCLSSPIRRQLIVHPLSPHPRPTACSPSARHPHVHCPPPPTTRRLSVTWLARLPARSSAMVFMELSIFLKEALICGEKLCILDVNQWVCSHSHFQSQTHFLILKQAILKNMRN